MDDFDLQALKYHRDSKPGKLTVVPSKPLDSQRDLALAYSPGVAAVCRAIVADPTEVAASTARSNLVAVITNGTAVLGLGDIGPLAAKPVMEGKAVLFKKFADIDVFDIEVNERDPARLADIVAALEPTFGAINLEDIKSPECFFVEKNLRERMGIPVFHDDQHGTAIVAGAALRNGLRVVGKDIGEVKIVSTGGGAAGIACLELFVNMGVKRENIVLVDHIGVVFAGRTEDMTEQKATFAVKTEGRRLGDVIDGADVFVGLSAPGILTAEMVRRMAARPLILALANPVPEIMPDVARAARPDAVVATGRSDFPNQVNNVLCFPFIFRGALDVGATTINEAMKLACVDAISDLALAESSEVVAQAYTGEDLTFGPDYLIPKPFDPRLLVAVAPAVAKAAMESGVATRPMDDLEAYREKLERFVFRTGMLMKPLFTLARRDPKRIVFAEGENPRVLRAVQTALDEGIALPILIGRARVIAARIEKLGLRLAAGRDFELTDPEDDPRYGDYSELYHDIMARRGVTMDAAKAKVRADTTAIAALMVRRGEADALIAGTVGPHPQHLRTILDILGKKEGVTNVAALTGLILPTGTYFFCDTHVNENPTVDQVVSMTLNATEVVRRFGIPPRVALLSYSTFGSAGTPHTSKMVEATQIIHEIAPDLMVDGEMNADVALNATLRERIFPNSILKGEANLLVFPSLDAANNAFNLLKVLSKGTPVGPILMGVAQPAHLVTSSTTARGLANMCALATVDAQLHEGEQEG
ncbi:MAG TPA: NADP-dependent malic enzyme [Hyphomicrobiales bacterium]|nr:NADP-dependent malic enzyme [Hyphomicrobiales bacterium]